MDTSACTSSQERPGFVEDIWRPRVSWSEGARKKALVIACNYYAQGKNELKGPKDDALNMQTILESKGYEVVMMLDQLPFTPPMRTRILQKMTQFITTSRAGDDLFLHYSGHGGQTKTKDPDEPSGMDEGIYPADFCRYRGAEKMISDDILHRVLATPNRNGVRLTCLFDSCHSGSVLDLPYVQRNSTDTELSEVTPRHEHAVHGMGGRIVLISGCMDSQVSMDTVVRGQHVGAMSSAFSRALEQFGDGNVTLWRLLETIRDKLRNHENEHYRGQIPVMSSDRKLNLEVEEFAL